MRCLACTGPDFPPVRDREGPGPRWCKDCRDTGKIDETQCGHCGDWLDDGTAILSEFYEMHFCPLCDESNNERIVRV